MALKRIDSLLNHVKPKKQAKQLSSGIDLTTINYNNLLDASYGLVIGAGIGDSLGSYREFTSETSQSDVIDYVMTMPGGGTWGSRVKAGQVTDDTELAVSLCRGIVHMINHQNDIINDNKSCNTPQNGQKFDFKEDDDDTNKDNNNNKDNNLVHVYDSHYAAKQYKRWYNADPFDIGGCTCSTISEAP